MFALWYLSLAVDELRKRFGWTFFDIFYKKDKTATNALDNKPANVVTPKPAEPAKSSVSKPAASTVTPKSTPAPAPTPTQKPTPAPAPAPVVKPVTPPTSKPAPIIESPKPAAVVEPPKTAAVVEPPKPAAVVERPKPDTPKRETVAKPTPAPTTPLKSVDQTAGQNGSLKDATDKMLMETFKPKENGNENPKNSLKNATAEFLSGEAIAHAPIKMSKLMSESNSSVQLLSMWSLLLPTIYFVLYKL